jgi:hypothetical protein
MPAIDLTRDLARVFDIKREIAGILGVLMLVELRPGAEGLTDLLEVQTGWYPSRGRLKIVSDEPEVATAIAIATHVRYEGEYYVIDDGNRPRKATRKWILDIAPTGTKVA